MLIRLLMIFMSLSLVTASCFATETNKPIKIATIYGQTGVAAESNAISLQGVELAVEQLNAEGGVLGRPIELLELDNKSSPLGSRQAALTAVKEKVVAVVGPAWSSHSLIAGPILNDAKIPMVSNIATNPAVTKDLEYVFRICFTDAFQGRVMAQFARKTLKAKTAVILTNVGAEYSIDLSSIFKQFFTQAEGDVLWEAGYREKQVDFSPLLSKIKQLNPDVVYLPGYYRDSGLILKQARLLGVQSQFLGADGWSAGGLREFGGEAVYGSYFSTHWHPKVEYPANEKLKRVYQAKYHQEIPAVAAMATGYDAMMVLADAITRANSTQGDKIRLALSQTRDFSGVTGSITLDEQGDPINKSAVILQISDNGEFKFIESVQPPSAQ